jgi:hypothetical protein
MRKCEDCKSELTPYEIEVCHDLCIFCALKAGDEEIKQRLSALFGGPRYAIN